MKKRPSEALPAAAFPKTPSLQRQKRKTTTSSMPPLAAVDARPAQPAAPALSPPWTRSSLTLAAKTLAELEPQRLAPLIEKHGVPFEKLLPKTTKTRKEEKDQKQTQNHHHHHFATLARAIVGQQVSGAAAATIYARVVTECLVEAGKGEAGRGVKEGFLTSTTLTPESLLAVPLPALRAAGLSERKASYLVGLAERFLDSGSGSSLSERLDELAEKGDSEAMITELVAVRGVGVWTAQMHVLFHAGGPDVLPTGDLGIKKGFAKLFGGKSNGSGDCGGGEEKKKKSKSSSSSSLPSEAQMLSWSEPFKPYRSLLSYYLWRAASE